MSLKFSQNLLILIVIILVCSITPATAAIQAKNNSLKENYNQTYDQEDYGLHLYTLFRDTVFNTFNEGTSTELTPEQDAYLQQQEDRLYTKSDAMLNNTQDFLNYLIDENYYYHPEEYENLTQGKLQDTRDDTDKFIADAKKMKDYLSNDANGPKITGMMNIQCTYDELYKYVNNSTYNKDNIFVQIRDSDGYIRYMRLISIDNSNIHLKSGSIDINEDPNRFNDLHVWHSDGKYSNPDLKFNILVSPSNYSYNDYILRQIWNKQYNELVVKDSRINTGTSLVIAAIGVGGIGVAANGAYRMCDGCKPKVKAKIDEEVPLDYQNGLEEFQALLVKNSLKYKCSSYRDKICSICGNSKTIFGFGVSVAASSTAVLFYMFKLKAEYGIDIRNLLTYEPPK
ncbi:hypothetical protein [Methanobacterium spitsbergense]|uniref:Uncharacterized protein n=1 Tax=Methanobacterium spitsbergense TaxID=2874285 RepID=A0A8T5UKV8_9EURY|nr:hypothetical protein [Methanobacterium spitsbergense]MBZ2164462.1 hypothetical protein [Methanobacterium spitsbergense]